MNDSPAELALSTPLGTFGGLAWRRADAPQVLCLHGWLDNAASFLPLAPFLEDLDLVALDFAGHGHSQHRAPNARYHFLDNLWDLEAVLDHLGWDACDLIGHSMGGALACVFAAIAPERVHRLVLLDGLGPVSSVAGDTLQRLRKSRESVRHATGRLREFANVETAVSARRSVSDLSREAAQLLCRRSLERFEDHYRWRTDPRLNWTSPVLMTEEQVLEILAAIEAPTLSISAEPLARWIDPEHARRRFDTMRDCRHRSIAGHHHFHMESPDAVAPLIIEFLQHTERTHVPSQI